MRWLARRHFALAQKAPASLLVGVLVVSGPCVISRGHHAPLVTYKNALKFFTGGVIRESNDADALSLYARQIQKYMDTL